MIERDPIRLDGLMDEVHKAMIEALALHTGKLEHQLRAIPKFEEQMWVAAAAASQAISQRIQLAKGRFSAFEPEYQALDEVGGSIFRESNRELKRR